MVRAEAKRPAGIQGVFEGFQAVTPALMAINTTNPLTPPLNPETLTATQFAELFPDATHIIAQQARILAPKRNRPGYGYVTAKYNMAVVNLKPESHKGLVECRTLHASKVYDGLHHEIRDIGSNTIIQAYRKDLTKIRKKTPR